MLHGTLFYAMPVERDEKRCQESDRNSDDYDICGFSHYRGQPYLALFNIAQTNNFEARSQINRCTKCMSSSLTNS